MGGYGRAAASYSLQSAFLGSSTQTAQAKSAFPALQALLGLDVKFSHSVYLSLLPQFIDPKLGHVLGQSLALGFTQIAISLCGNATIALAAGSIALFLAAVRCGPSSSAG